MLRLRAALLGKDDDGAPTGGTSRGLGHAAPGVERVEAGDDRGDPHVVDVRMHEARAVALGDGGDETVPSSAAHHAFRFALETSATGVADAIARASSLS